MKKGTSAVQRHLENAGAGTLGVPAVTGSQVAVGEPDQAEQDRRGLLGIGLAKRSVGGAVGDDPPQGLDEDLASQSPLVTLVEHG
jgi:hypothetical protein